MGRPQWETIVANAARERMVGYTRQIAGGSLGPGAGSSAISVYSAPGTISTVVGLFISALKPSGATSGSHKVVINYAGPIMNLLWGESNFGADLAFNCNCFQTADKLQVPATAESQVSNVLGISFDSVSPVVLFYNNNTNALQNNIVDFRIWVRERTVGG